MAFHRAVGITSRESSGGAFIVTGPEALSFADVAGKFSARLSKSVVYVDQPADELVRAMKGRGVPDQVAGSFGQMMAAFAASEASEITTAVRDLTGRDARGFDEFLADNIDVFRETERVLPLPQRS